MTSTSQSTDANGKEGLEPTKETSSADKEPRSVPLDQHIELRQEVRALREKLAQMEKTAAPQKAASDPATPKTPVENDSQMALIQQLVEKDRIRDLRMELGLQDEKQAAAVAKLLKESPGLSPTEALTIMATRDQDLFGSGGGGSDSQASFATLRPRPGSQPQTEQKEPTLRQRFEHINSLGVVDKREQTKQLYRVIGHEAAKSIGWESKLPPLPQK